ncbi:MAG: hypothetical protein M1388_02225 [Thaumarchaeota archaeon]|nr:hypothetical protein [Nitrososphaerota archaeon]
MRLIMHAYACRVGVGVALQWRWSILIECLSSIMMPMVNGALYKLAGLTENSLAPMAERKRG